MHGNQPRDRRWRARDPRFNIEEDEECCHCECNQREEVRARPKLQSSLSRSKSRKKVKKMPLGLMERNVYQNMDYYKTLNSTIKTPLHTHAYTHEQEQDYYASLFPKEAELKPKPQLNQKSKKLYQKIRRERRLSPNVFDRLQADEEKRSRQKVVSIIKRIKEVTPTKKLTRTELQQFSTPRQMRYFEQYLNLPPTE